MHWEFLLGWFGGLIVGLAFGVFFTWRAAKKGIDRAFDKIEKTGDNSATWKYRAERLLADVQASGCGDRVMAYVNSRPRM